VIGITVRNIAIVAPSIYCDVCSASLDLVREVTIASIRRVPYEVPSFGSYSSDGTFEADGIPTKEDTALKVAESRGWKQETFHGRRMLVCPHCSAAPVLQEGAK
jgi:hypothetical protein